MPTLQDLSIIDLRAKLPHRNWSNGTRDGTTSITVHYNGPPVAASQQRGPGLITRLVNDATYQMQPGWGGSTNGAPGLMYHLVVDAEGIIYQAQDLDAILWHCAHSDGNNHGLSIHFPLGEGQDATDIQWARGLQLVEALRAQFGVPRGRVFGHLEWKHATACPGNLQPRVLTYRAGAVVVPPTPTIIDGLRRFKLFDDLAAPARVRQQPRVHLLDGSGEVPIATRLKAGTIVQVDTVITTGEAIEGNTNWVHMALVPNEQADAGFISETLGSWLP